MLPVEKCNNLSKLVKTPLANYKIAKSYQKFNIILIKNIKKEVNTIEAELQLDGRIEIFNQHKTFITFKDYKVNFKNYLLILPSWI